MPDNLVLTGMMGTGKSTVGQVVAEQTGRQFVDLDESIERAAGRSVRELFATQGEVGFRQAERQAVKDLVENRGAVEHSSGCVVATGGWTIADTESRTRLEALGPTVCLTASIQALSERLDASESQSRPLLGQFDVHGTDLGRLVEDRRSVYLSVPLQVDTTDRSPAIVADLTIKLANQTNDLAMSAIPVNTRSDGYSVVVAPGLLEPLGAVLAARVGFGRACIVTDPVVSELYGRQLLASLKRSGADATIETIDGGETGKSLQTVSELYRGFLGAGLERNDLVIALGGGVIGDTAGFAAATFMRGVKTAIVPTTLLAMVDSSIGGKTGVNLPEGKNLVGAFQHPEMVAVDPSLLVSLPKETLHAGLAEVVKAGMIADVGLLELIEAEGAHPAQDVRWWSDVITSAASVKALVVSNDPEERGQRIVLNLGHTFAHALETASGHAVEHGHAVAVGLVAAARLSARLGLADTALGDRVECLLKELDLPVRFTGPTSDEVITAMSTDKKRRGGDLRFVLPIRPGEVRVVDYVPSADVSAVVSDLRVE